MDSLWILPFNILWVPHLVVQAVDRMGRCAHTLIVPFTTPRPYSSSSLPVVGRLDPSRCLHRSLRRRYYRQCHCCHPRRRFEKGFR